MGPEVSGSPTTNPPIDSPQRRAARLATSMSSGVARTLKARSSTYAASVAQARRGRNPDAREEEQKPGVERHGQHSLAGRTCTVGHAGARSAGTSSAQLDVDTGGPKDVRSARRRAAAPGRKLSTGEWQDPAMSRRSAADYKAVNPQEARLEAATQRFRPLTAFALAFKTSGPSAAPPICPRTCSLKRCRSSGESVANSSRRRGLP